MLVKSDSQPCKRIGMQKDEMRGKVQSRYSHSDRTVLMNGMLCVLT